MGFLDKLLGRGASDSGSKDEPSKTGEEQPIRVFDSYGRELLVPREEWRTKILPANIKKHWDDADSLYSIIVQSLGDGLVSDIAFAARRLFEIDRDLARSAAVLGIVEMELGRLDAAESVLKGALGRTGEDGILLTNLAKVIAKKGDSVESERTLWRALQADPNQDNGLLWWVAIHRERGGERAERQALERVAALPGSFRASLWLARSALQRGDRQRALDLYATPLALNEIPGDVLMQISGDLGNAGMLNELLALVAPHFRIETHGIAVGNNLLKTYVDLGRFTDARKLLEQLYACRRPDWRQTLEFWERELDDKTRGFGPVAEQQPAIAVLQVVGPVWCREMEGLAALLPQKAAGAPRVAVMMPSCTPTKPSDVAVSQRTNVEGSLSRALALALAESVHLDTSAVGIALVPVVATGPNGGFVLAGAPWSIDALLAAAGRETTPVAAIASLHLNASTNPWLISMTIHATSSPQPILTRQLEVNVDPSNPEAALTSLRTVLNSAAVELPGVSTTTRPGWSQHPHGSELASWLAGTEQCLAVVCADPSSGGPAIALYGERSVVDGILAAAVGNPGSVPWRMLLVTVLTRLAKVRPEIVADYVDRAEKLMREHALDGNVGYAIAQAVSSIRVGSSKAKSS